jgi:hypothetical protein
MTDTAASDAARALAARRPRAVFICEVCGAKFEAWQRKKQKARTCSGKCRAALFRRNRPNGSENGTREAV